MVWSVSGTEGELVFNPLITRRTAMSCKVAFLYSQIHLRKGQKTSAADTTVYVYTYTVKKNTKTVLQIFINFSLLSAMEMEAQSSRHGGSTAVLV